MKKRQFLRPVLGVIGVGLLILACTGERGNAILKPEFTIKPIPIDTTKIDTIKIIAATAADIVINEVFSEGGVGTYSDYIELYNKSTSPFTIVGSDWLIQDGKNTDSLFIPNGTVITGKGVIAFCAEPGVTNQQIAGEVVPRYVPDGGFGLSGSKGDCVKLYYKGAITDSLVWGANELQNSGARIPDGGAWTTSATPSPNTLNGN